MHPFVPVVVISLVPLAFWAGLIFGTRRRVAVANPRPAASTDIVDVPSRVPTLALPLGVDASASLLAGDVTTDSRAQPFDPPTAQHAVLEMWDDGGERWIKAAPVGRLRLQRGGRSTPIGRVPLPFRAGSQLVTQPDTVIDDEALATSVDVIPARDDFAFARSRHLVAMSMSLSAAQLDSVLLSHTPHDRNDPLTSALSRSRSHILDVDQDGDRLWDVAIAAMSPGEVTLHAVGPWTVAGVLTTSRPDEWTTAVPLPASGLTIARDGIVVCLLQPSGYAEDDPTGNKR